MTTELVAAIPPPQTLMKPIATPQQLIAYHGDMINIIQKALKEGTDYGVIPGTKKPTLYKAGAERINIAFGTHPRYELVEKEINHNYENIYYDKYKKKNETSFGLYRYVYKCRITKADGQIVAEGEGVCSSLEAKYISRPRDSENTVCKMSQKRAFMAATLHAFGLSDQFTQDLDDHVEAMSTAEKASPTFDPLNEAHATALIMNLQKINIGPEFHDGIAAALKGRPWNQEEVRAAIAKVTGRCL